MHRRVIEKQRKTPDKIRNTGPFVCKYDLAEVTGTAYCTVTRDK
jgi:hypothetical protein